MRDLLPGHFNRYILGSGLLLAIATGATKAADDLQPMFNGQDLSGWVLTNTPAETWQFDNGLLVCSGKPIGEIRTEKMYQNFVMELEWRHMVAGGNAGVFVWADDITSRGVPFHRGIEVQVLENAYGNTRSHTTHGDIFPIHGASMTPVNGRGGSRAFPTENRSRPSPEWNHYRIECRDGEISLAVNGPVVTRGRDCVPRKGYICLESEGGVVHYRNVKIQELPPTPIATEQIAIADRGYRSLYTGLNLDGWQPSVDAKAWTVRDWILAYDAESSQEVQPEAASDRLTSTEAFASLGCVVDVRLKSDASNAVIHVGPSLKIDLSDPRFADSLQPMGSWNRIEVNRQAGVYAVHVNGHEPIATDAAISSKPSTLSLAPSGKVEFCNLYGRSLSP
jgi:hypothetical protein